MVIVIDKFELEGLIIIVSQFFLTLYVFFVILQIAVYYSFTSLASHMSKSSS